MFMKKLIVLCLFFLGFYSWASVDSNYKLDAGDSIRITVFGEDDLSLELTLGEQGLINYPYLGIIRASGMTPTVLENRLISGLKGDYLINPSVNVSIVEYRPFFIHGEVEKPGGYPYQPGLTLERAVALAGGFTERASRDKMSINRKANNIDAVINAKLKSLIEPGDSIFIKDSFF